MSFEDDMIEFGFSSEDDYLDYLYAQSKEFQQDNLDEPDWEYLQMQNEIRKEERNKFESECLRKGNIIKQWSKENPLLSELWYAYVSHDPSFSKLEFESFIDNLGKTPINKNMNEIYSDWEQWVKNKYAYEEFKERAADVYINLNRELKHEEALQAIQTMGGYGFGDLGYNVERIRQYVHETDVFCPEVYRRSPGKYKVIQRWFCEHQELLYEVKSQYGSKIRSDEEYKFIAWREKFPWDDSFEVWKYKNPTQIQYLREQANNMSTIDLCDFGKWKSDNIEVWNMYRLENDADWQRCRESYSRLLWCAYTDEKWGNHMSQKMREDCPEIDLTDDELWDIMIESEMSYNKYSIPEEKVEDVLEEYHQSLVNNPDKVDFIKENCSEYEMIEYLQPPREWISPETKADWKLFLKWISHNRTLWEDWYLKYYYNYWATWRKGNICYDSFTSFSEKDYYEAWVNLYPLRWEKWLKKYFSKWKSKAVLMDLWFMWCSNGNLMEFHEWAIHNSQLYRNVITFQKNLYFNEAYENIFNEYLFHDIEKWKRTSIKEWRRWRSSIYEKIIEHKLMGHFFDSYDSFYVPSDLSHSISSSCNLPYVPEYLLEFDIIKLLISNKLGYDVFHDDRALVEHNHHYGYIDPSGTTVIDLIYDDAKEFKYGVAAVKLINPNPSLFRANDDNDINNSGKWGVIDRNGNFIIPPIYDSISEFNNGFAIISLYDSTAAIDSNNILKKKWGIISISGRIIVNPQYEYISFVRKNLYFARTNNHWGILDEYGKVLVPFLYDYVFYESGKIIANIGGGVMENTVLGKHVYGGRWGYVDLNEPISYEDMIEADNLILFLQNTPQ